MHYRNIFVEEGLVSTITTYYKGYSVIGSTKIIHRYLPKEVGELVVYYLWLILPFSKALGALALNRDLTRSAYLWGEPDSRKDSYKLSLIHI